MIDEKKLIEYLRSEARRDRSKVYGEHECEVIEATIRMCIGIVKAFPKADEWILVSEMLPEDGKYIVTTDGTFGIDVIDIARFEEFEWHKSAKILAWMPLPEPYKEGHT